MTSLTDFGDDRPELKDCTRTADRRDFAAAEAVEAEFGMRRGPLSKKREREGGDLTDLDSNLVF
jgi:hypothetical protein